MKSRPILRRAIAAALLYAVAIGSALLFPGAALTLWREADGTGVSISALSINLVVATLGSIWLHFRWRARERRALSPRKVKDIFS